MLSPRQRVILRQIVSPPYIYRWAGLLTTIALMAGVTAVVLTDVGSRQVLATGSAPAATSGPAGRPARPAADAPVLGMPGMARPAITPSLLTVTDSSVEQPSVALTFDDGPTSEYTPEVLDILAENDVKATFCMIGDQARANPDVVQRVVAAGNRLCDHTMTHDSTIGAGAEDTMNQQLVRSRTSLSTVVDPAVTIDYFRAPEGRWSPLLDQTSARTGMRPLGWSVDPLDWSRPGAPTIVSTVKQGLHPGAVILFHDGGGPREQTVEAVRELVPWLKDQGYRFVFPS